MSGTIFDPHGFLVGHSLVENKKIPGTIFECLGECAPCSKSWIKLSGQNLKNGKLGRASRFFCSALGGVKLVHICMEIQAGG